MPPVLEAPRKTVITSPSQPQIHNLLGQTEANSWWQYSLRACSRGEQYWEHLHQVDVGRGESGKASQRRCWLSSHLKEVAGWVGCEGCSSQHKQKHLGVIKWNPWTWTGPWVRLESRSQWGILRAKGQHGWFMPSLRWHDEFGLVLRHWGFTQYVKWGDTVTYPEGEE